MFISAQKTRGYRRAEKNLERARAHPPEAPPAAYAQLERGAENWIWAIDACPYCGHRHIHGGGSLYGDPRQLLGDRAPHCAGDKTGLPNYLLVEG